MHISYTFISRILSYNLSYTILYFYLHSYNFHIRYSCILSYVFHLFLVFFHLYIPIECQSFPLHVLCLWHSTYLYFSCISVSILCIFHIHSITYCFMSLTYLLSILSYLKYFHITYLILSYTFIYILILFIYGTFVTFTCF